MGCVGVGVGDCVFVAGGLRVDERVDVGVDVEVLLREDVADCVALGEPVQLAVPVAVVEAVLDVVLLLDMVLVPLPLYEDETVEDAVMDDDSVLEGASALKATTSRSDAATTKISAGPKEA